MAGKIDTEVTDNTLVESYKNGSKDGEISADVLPLLVENKNQLLGANLYTISEGPEKEDAIVALDQLSLHYNYLVTAVIDLAEARTNDISDSTIFQALFDSIKQQLEELIVVKSQNLNNLRSNIFNRVNFSYDTKPVLRDKVKALTYRYVGSYVLNPCKDKEEYSNGDVIAFLGQNFLKVESANLMNIPLGMDLNASTGEVSVTNAEEIVSGSYALNITTTDEKGGETDHIVSFQIRGGNEITDAEAKYTVLPAKKIQEYGQFDTLATVTDPDGDIIRATLRKGEMPKGMLLNTITGEVFVKTPKELIGQTHKLEINTFDVHERVTEHTILIPIVGDSPSEYDIKPFKLVEDYQVDDVIGTLSDPDGAITEVVVSPLPPGVAINPTDGGIYVSDKNALVPGIYRFSITIEDCNGDNYVNPITLVIDPADDIEANYTDIPPKKIDEWRVGDIVASVSDNDGDIIKAEITAGLLPPGTTLNRFNGDIVISNKTLLSLGSTDVSIRTTDEKCNTTIHDLTITMDGAVGPDYVIEMNCDNFLTKFPQTAPLNVAYVANPGDVNIVSAEISSGTLDTVTYFDFNTTNGTINTQDGAAPPAELLFEPFTVKLTDDTGRDFYFDVNWYCEVEAAYTINAPKPYDQYVNGDVLATVSDANGTIVSAQLLEGSLPAGTALNGANGEITVTDATQIVEGTFSNIKIKTVDEKGGTSENTIEIVFNPQGLDIYEHLDLHEYGGYVPSSSYSIGWVKPSAGITVTSSSITAGTLYDYYYYLDEDTAEIKVYGIHESINTGSLNGLITLEINYAESATPHIEEIDWTFSEPYFIQDQKRKYSDWPGGSYLGYVRSPSFGSFTVVEESTNKLPPNTYIDGSSIRLAAAAQFAAGDAGVYDEIQLRVTNNANSDFYIIDAEIEILASEPNPNYRFVNLKELYKESNIYYAARLLNPSECGFVSAVINNKPSNFDDYFFFSPTSGDITIDTHVPDGVTFTSFSIDITSTTGVHTFNIDWSS